MMVNAVTTLMLPLVALVTIALAADTTPTPTYSAMANTVLADGFMGRTTALGSKDSAYPRQISATEPFVEVGLQVLPAPVTGTATNAMSPNATNAMSPNATTNPISQSPDSSMESETTSLVAATGELDAGGDAGDDTDVALVDKTVANSAPGDKADSALVDKSDEAPDDKSDAAPDDKSDAVPSDTTDADSAGGDKPVEKTNGDAAPGDPAVADATEDDKSDVDLASDGSEDASKSDNDITSIEAKRGKSYAFVGAVAAAGMLAFVGFFAYTSMCRRTPRSSRPYRSGRPPPSASTVGYERFRNDPDV